jgi:hypothetical protein
MAPKQKQAERRAGKKEKKDEDTDAADGQSATGQNFADLAKALVLNSILVQIAPSVPNFATDAIAIVKGEKKTQPKAEKKEEDDNKENEDSKDETNKENENEKSDTNGDSVVPKDACGVFSSMCSRLHWSNPLGLGSPASGSESLKAWKDLKGLELDFGPRPKKKGNPGLERITANLYNNLPQYLHILLCMMMLRAFLFRSFFACLPWLVGYQSLSVFLPLDVLPSAPQIPLDKVPVEARIIITVALNGLVQLFFVYELLLKTYWLEIFLYVGLVVYHSYAVRPIDA